MLSLDRISELLEGDEQSLSDSELKEMRSLLYYLARLAVENRLNQQRIEVQA